MTMPRGQARSKAPYWTEDLENLQELRSMALPTVEGDVEYVDEGAGRDIPVFVGHVKSVWWIFFPPFPCFLLGLLAFY